MSSILYNKAFEAELSHAFYVYTDAPVNNAFKVNRDMKVLPTKECAELMRKGRLRFIPTQKGFVTFYQAYVNPSNVQEPMVKLANNSEFVFSMHMDPASISLFLNVSNLNVGSKTYGPGKFFMLNQKVVTATPAAPQTLAYTATLANSLRNPIFGYTFKPALVWTGLADIIIRRDSDVGPVVLTLTGVPHNAVNNTFNAEIDLSQQPKGFYVLNAFKAGSTNPLDQLDSNDFYVDGDLASQNTFGIMRVIYEDISKLYQTTTGVTQFYTFNYAFVARTTKWRYYVVAENLDANFFTLFDLKVLKSGGPVFNASFPPPGSPFTQIKGQPDPKVKVNGKRTVILESDTAIAFSEAPQKGYELWKDPIPAGADERIIPNLPNPNALGVDSDQWGTVQTPPTITPGISEIFVFV